MPDIWEQFTIPLLIAVTAKWYQKKLILYLWKNLTSWAGQLEIRPFMFQYISNHHFWEKTQHNSDLMGLLKVSGFLMYIQVRLLKIDKCVLTTLYSIKEAYHDHPKM